MAISRIYRKYWRKCSVDSSSDIIKSALRACRFLRAQFKQVENRLSDQRAHRAGCQFSKRLRGISPGRSLALSRETAGILHDNDGTRAPTGMIRQSIVRGNRRRVQKKKRRAKSACDATAMLRFFRARLGATTGWCVHYFQHRFCAFRPLTHSTVNPPIHIHIHTHTHSPSSSVDRPATLLFPVERVRRRAFFEYSTCLFLSHPLSLSSSRFSLTLVSPWRNR